jgi:hypothetical protein
VPAVVTVPPVPAVVIAPPVPPVDTPPPVPAAEVAPPIPDAESPPLPDPVVVASGPHAAPATNIRPEARAHQRACIGKIRVVTPRILRAQSDRKGA